MQNINKVRVKVKLSSNLKGPWTKNRVFCLFKAHSVSP